jgi:hypothetical protein
LRRRVHLIVVPAIREPRQLKPFSWVISPGAGKGQTLLALFDWPECQVPGDTLVATRPSVAPPEVSDGLQWSAMPGAVTATSMTPEPAPIMTATAEPAPIIAAPIIAAPIIAISAREREHAGESNRIVLNMLNRQADSIRDTIDLRNSGNSAGLHG